MPATDILPEWLLGPLPDGDKILPLGDQVEVERILLKESLRKISPSLDRDHVRRSEPLEHGAGQTLLKYADKEPFVSLKLSKVPIVCLQMRDGAASTIVSFELRDAEFRRECGLWKVAEVPELVGLAVLALH